MRFIPFILLAACQAAPEPKTLERQYPMKLEQVRLLALAALLESDQPLQSESVGPSAVRMEARQATVRLIKIGADLTQVIVKSRSSDPLLAQRIQDYIAGAFDASATAREVYPFTLSRCMAAARNAFRVNGISIESENSNELHGVVRNDYAFIIRLSPQTPATTEVLFAPQAERTPESNRLLLQVKAAFEQSLRTEQP
jgi:hypothetical protein